MRCYKRPSTLCRLVTAIGGCVCGTKNIWFSGLTKLNDAGRHACCLLIVYLLISIAVLGSRVLFGWSRLQFLLNRSNKSVAKNMMEKNLIIFTSKSKSENFQVKEKLLENRNIRCRVKLTFKRERNNFFCFSNCGSLRWSWTGA